MKKKIILIILIVCILLIVIGCEKSKPNLTEEEMIVDILDDFIAGMNIEKEIEIKKTDIEGSYNVFINYKVYDDSYDNIGYEAINYIDDVKNSKYSEKIDQKIKKYIIYFYKDHNLVYTAEYDNVGLNNIDKISIKNNNTNEKFVYTLEDKNRYVNALKEKWNKEEENRKLEDEKKKQEAEQKKNNSQVIHNVGETVLCPEFEITLNNFEIKKEGTSINMLYAIDDPEWIGVILTIKNIGAEEKTFYNQYVRLQNSAGEIINPNSSANYDIWGVQGLNSPTLISQASKKGYILYVNNSQDNSKLYLLVNCGIYTSNNDILYKYHLK